MPTVAWRGVAGGARRGQRWRCRLRSAPIRWLAAKAVIPVQRIRATKTYLCGNDYTDRSLLPGPPAPLGGVGHSDNIALGLRSCRRQSINNDNSNNPSGHQPRRTPHRPTMTHYDFFAFLNISPAPASRTLNPAPRRRRVDRSQYEARREDCEEARRVC